MQSPGILTQKHALASMEKEWNAIKAVSNSEAQLSLLDMCWEMYRNRLLIHTASEEESLDAALLLCVRPSSLPVKTVQRGKIFILTEGPKFLAFHQKKNIRCSLDGAEEERLEALRKDDDPSQKLKRTLEHELGIHLDADDGAISGDKFDLQQAVTKWKLELWNERHHLALLAKMFLCIRASEAGAERVFSHASLRKSSLRNRLKVETLDSEVFVRVNSKWLGDDSYLPKDEEHIRIRRKKSRTLAKQKEDDAAADAFAILEETEGIATQCLPLLAEKEIFEFLSCSACGLLHTSGDDDLWWRCCQCLSPFCGQCCDDHLDDDSGLCDDCDPEKCALHNVQRGKRDRR
jgi:hypothetical protein